MFEHVAHTGPGPQWRRRQETTVPHRLLGIRHTTPDPDAALGRATQIAQVGMYDGRMSDDD
ncbi:hypothetical protein MMOR_38780 [Mycolicibacterium moriokaense]|uniref:Uncharacterized protein n=1 Tax=Mycolicibacterium moriokaense TaxID=39691 RepID=A0AAD1M6L4_9MYCO|nr:hypothetical protein MMOR_38780 [Mycolicibacterium moriokaense]